MRGLAAAREAGATTVLFGGGDGGPAAEHADHALLVPSDSTARIQELHVFFLHVVIDQVDAWAAGERVKKRAHDRQRAHRPGVALAVAGGLPGGARHVPVRDRPDGGVPGLRLHLRLGRSSSSGSRRATRRCSSGSRRGSPRAASRSSAAGGSSRTATSRRGESFVRQALYGQRYLRETFGIIATTGANVDSFGHNASIPQILAQERRRLVRLPAARAGGERAREPALLVGVAGRLARARLPDPARVLRAEGRPRRARREGDRARCPTDDEEYAVFYGVGNHGGGPTKANLDQIARLNEHGRRAAARAQLAAPLLRRASRASGEPAGASAASSSTTRPAATRRTPGSSAGTGAPRTCCSAPRSGARSPTSLGLRPYPLGRADAGVEAPPLQPVPRHARRHVDRARLRGRARPDRARVVARGERLQRRRPDDRAADRDRAGGGDAAGRRLQPAPVAAARRRRGRVHVAARGGRVTSSTTRASPCRCS